jgi:hypothetical protein
MTRDRVRLRIARVVWEAWRALREDTGDFTTRTWNTAPGDGRAAMQAAVDMCLHTPEARPWTLENSPPGGVALAHAIVENFRPMWNVSGTKR